MAAQTASPRVLRWLAAALALVVAVVLFAVLGLFAALDRGSLDGAVMRFASARLGRPVQFQSLSTHLLKAQPQVTVTGLRIGAPAWAQGAPDTLRATRIHARLRWPSLLRGALEPSVLEIDGAQAHLLRQDKTHETWRSSKKGGGGDPLAHTARLVVTNSRFVFEDRPAGMKLSGDIGHHAGRDPAWPFTLTAAGVVQGGAVQLVARGGALNSRRRGAPYPMTASLTDGDVRLQARGTLDRPLSFKGFDLAVSAQGPNLVALEYLLDLGTPNSTPFKLKGRIRRKGEVTRATGLSGVIGASTMSGSIISDGSGKRRLLTIAIEASDLHMRDLAAILSARPSHAVARVTPGAPADGDRLFSTKALDLTRFNRKEVDLSLSARRFVTGTLAPATFSAKGRLRDGVMTLDPLRLTFPSGRLSARYLVDVRKSNIVMEIDGRLDGAQLSSLAPAVAGTVDGRADLHLKARGAGRSIHQIVAAAKGEADLSLHAGELKRSAAQVISGSLVKGVLTVLVAKSSTTPLSCANATFAIGGGAAATRDLVLVSGAGSTLGEGAIDLKNERIDLRFYGVDDGRVSDRKPVRILGPLTKPEVQLRAKDAPTAAVTARPCR